MTAVTVDLFPEFGVTVTIDSAQSALAVRGEVDLLTAPTLRAGLGILVEMGHRKVVLDLSALAFMDASGLGVVADIAGRLATTGRVLTVRAAPAQVLRILHICRMKELLQIEASDSSIATAGAERAVSLATASDTAELRANLARVASSRSNDTIDAALRLVALLAAATIRGADGVSVTLERDGRMVTVASSNDTIMQMDRHQYETGEGPCLSAAAEGHTFHAESLAEETRWPAFVPRAIGEGIASILSTAVVTTDRTQGALNIYSTTERVFGPHQQELAALFASQTSGILGDARADSSDQMSERIADALIARETIAQAQGMLMEREHINGASAATTLHQSARIAGVPVLSHASDIVASRAIVSARPEQSHGG